MSNRFNFLGNWSASGMPTYVTSSSDVPVNIVTRINTLLPEYRNQSSSLETLSGTEIDKVIATTGDTEVWLSFVDENAGYNSCLGYYTFPLRGGLKVPNKKNTEGGEADYVPLTRLEMQTNTTDVSYTMIFPKIKKNSRNGPLNVGDKAQLMFNFGGVKPTPFFPSGYGIGFFLIADGWNQNTQKFVQDGVTYLNACNNSRNLVGYNITGKSSIIYSQNTINTENLEQCILLKDFSSVDSDKTFNFYMSFEDIMRINGAGDNDFNDVIFRVTYTPSTNATLGKTLLQSVPEPIQNTNDNILIAADSSGMFFWPSAKNYKNIIDNWTNNGNITLTQTISVNSDVYAASLYTIFKNIAWYITGSTLTSVNITYDNLHTITCVYKFKKSHISNHMYFYLSASNQTQMYNSVGVPVKNLVKFQTDYIFAQQCHPGIILTETHTAIDDSTKLSINTTGSISAINFASTTAQGDPYIRTIHGLNYKLPDTIGYVKLYDNGELVINAHVKKYDAYKDHRLDVLRDATFVHSTSLMLIDENRNIKQHVIIDNMTLELADSTCTDASLFFTNKNDTDPLFHSKFANVPQRNYDYRFAVVTTEKLGDVMVRFIRYKEEDLLTASDMMDNASMLMSDSIGAFISDKNIRWMNDLLDVTA